MQVTVEIMNEDAELIQQLLNSFGEREPCSNSHGNLDIANLADAARRCRARMAQTRFMGGSEYEPGAQEPRL